MFSYRPVHFVLHRYIGVLGNNICCRGLSASSGTAGTDTEGRVTGHDEEIPVPWGVIGARRWGDTSKKPILCVHGWKDNLATFDRIMPLLLPSLKDQYYFLTIDLPGHGHSSHFPPGMLYQVSDCLVLIRRILNHYNWSTISYLGHSLGAILGFIYNGTNPGVIDRYVAIDALTPHVFSKDDTLEIIPKLITDTLGFEEKLKRNKPPLYSYEEIQSRIIRSNISVLHEQSARTLMARGIRESQPGSGMFHFTHDIRVHHLPMMTLSSNQVSYIAKNLRSHVLHIGATDGANYERPSIATKSRKWIQAYKPEERDINLVEVDGNHHVHLNDPEVVAPHIIKFFKKNLKPVT